MDLLLVLIIILVLFAVFGGLYLSPFIWLILVVALLVFLFGGRGRYYGRY